MRIDISSLARLATAITLTPWLLTGGCQAPSAEVAYAPPQPPRPGLASARDDAISLFGELPAHDEAPYLNRSRLSLKQHTDAEEGADYDADIDADGTRLVFASTRHAERPDLYIKDVDGVAVTQLTADPASDVQPAFSPDGSRVAFASDRGGNWDIWITGVDGTAPVQVTTTAGEELHPSWSPDGQRLVYCSLPHRGQWELWIADAAAAGRKTFIGYGVFPEWSPVEDVIVYQRARQRGSRWFSIWTLTLVNGEPRHPTEIAASSEYAMILPTWSPDGSRIAFTAATATSQDAYGAGEPAALSDIWVVDGDGRSRIRLTDGFSANYGAVISADERVYFTSDRGGRENIWSMVLPRVVRPGVVEKTAQAPASGADEPPAAPVPPAARDAEMAPLAGMMINARTASDVDGSQR